MMKLTNLFVQKYKNIQASTCQIKPDTSESNLQIRGDATPLYRNEYVQIVRNLLL